MNRYKLYIVAATIALFAQNGHSEKSKLKIPHNHAPMEGGSVVMLGDDHFEIRPSKNENELEVFASDKVRDPLEISGLKEFSVSLVLGDTKTKLETAPSTSNSVLVKLPPNHSMDSVIEIFSKRNNPPKNHIAASSPQKISLKQVYSSKTQDPHSGHKM